jgi:hypothetical protein
VEGDREKEVKKIKLHQRARAINQQGENGTGRHILNIMLGARGPGRS